MNFVICKLALITLLGLFTIISSSLAFSVSGSILNIEVAPGQEFVHTITVKNGEDDSILNLTAELFGFGMSLTGGNIKVAPEKDNSTYSARSFLMVTPNNFRLGPGDSQEVILKGKIPDDIGAGGRYAVVNIRTEPMGDKSVGVITAVDVPIMLTIKESELIEAGEITDLEVSKDEADLNARLIFKNTGNHHYKASSKMVVKGESDKVVYEAETPLEVSSILPSNMRQFQIKLDSKNNLEPGTYTVEVSVIHENGTVLDTAEKTIKV